MPTELDISLLEEDWGRTVRSLFLSSPDFNHQSHKDTHTHTQSAVSVSPLLAIPGLHWL